MNRRVSNFRLPDSFENTELANFQELVKQEIMESVNFDSKRGNCRLNARARKARRFSAKNC